MYIYLWAIQVSIVLQDKQLPASINGMNRMFKVSIHPLNLHYMPHVKSLYTFVCDWVATIMAWSEQVYIGDRSTSHHNSRH